VVNKIFQPSTLRTRIYILSRTHILLKINMFLIQTTRSLRGRIPHFRNLWDRQKISSNVI
jgi:hypothetical protein